MSKLEESFRKKLLTGRLYESLLESAKYFFEEWYRENVSSNLTSAEKKKLAKKISELTLKNPIWLDRETNYIEDFPELKPYSNSGRITGLQLCAVLSAIVKELQSKL